MKMEQLVGGLSTPSKMPGYAYGLPANECKIGSILRKKKGSVCSNCYAFRGCYVFPVVRKAQANRLRILEKDLFSWTRSMISLIDFKYRRKRGKQRVFRWHDSGDIQSVEHLSAIVTIAKMLPSIRFWLPTRERGMLSEWLAENPQGFPTNLTVRVSVPMVGQAVSAGFLPTGTVGSTVGSGTGFACPALRQENECRSCRACWDSTVKSVDYTEH